MPLPFCHTAFGDNRHDLAADRVVVRGARVVDGPDDFHGIFREEAVEATCDCSSGARAARDAARFVSPSPTHGDTSELFGPLLPRNTTRSSLGLPKQDFDVVAPTLRSGFTGPRNTTGVLNSKAALKIWNDLQIWPNGVQRTRESATAYPPENGHFRMSVADCALLQGFPDEWQFSGAVYQVLGQIGNSVCPPVAYAVARQVARALGVA